jgi:cytochrome P450
VSNETDTLPVQPLQPALPAATDQEAIARLTARYDHLDRALSLPLSIEVTNQLREQPGCPYSDAHGGFYVLTQHADVVEAQKSAGGEPPLFSYAEGILQPRNDRPRAIPIDFDEPEHGDYRKLFMNVLNKATVDGFEPQLLEEINEVISDFIALGEGNFSSEVARRLPIAVIGRLIGWGSGVSARTQVLVEEMMAGLETQGEPPARRELIELFDHELEQRRLEPRDDYLTELASATVDGRPITDGEVKNTLLTFLFGGYETTASVTGTMMVQLARNPDLQERLREQPELIAPAIEEILRLYPPVHLQFRTVTQDTEIEGTQIPAGSRAGVVWVAANHDPKQFENPEEFRLDRANVRRHLAYGFGVHVCAGIHLARLEMLRFWEEFLGRGYRFELAGEPIHKGMFIGHDAGWEDVPIRCVSV